MAIDPSDPETFTDGEDDPAETDVEAPQNDAAEQQTDVRPERDDVFRAADRARADEADLIEQARVVSLDEDDYR